MPSTSVPVTVTVTFCTPVGPSFWMPSPLVSRQTKSPSCAGRSRPASMVWLNWPAARVTGAVTPSWLASLSVTSKPFALTLGTV